MLDKLPDSLILKILDYCAPLDVCHVGQLSRTLRDVCSDQLLWRTLFHRHFHLQKFHATPFSQRTWKSEFIRLHDQVPIVECEVSRLHADEVLHVAFSNDGERFATSGKDGNVRVWNATTLPVELEFTIELRNLYGWKYAQFSQFNETDSLLLVSGVISGLGENVNGGEIIIFDMERNGGFVCRNSNRPYDVFGIWCSDEYFLSGELTWLAHEISKAEIWLNKASQETDSEHKAVLHCLYKFYNKANSSVRALLVANVASPVLPELTAGRDNVTPLKCPRIGVDGHGANQVERTKRHISDDEETQVPCSSKSLKMDKEELDMAIDDEDKDDVDKKEKVLIFTCGSSTYIPHQIGFKRMGSCKLGRIDPGPTLSERIEILAERKQRRAEAQARGDAQVEFENYERVAHLFDKYDAMIDLKGHIIGMALSPDNRYLYVNCRAWPAGAIISDPGDPPPIAQEIDIRVFDLTTLMEVVQIPSAHRAFTPNDECFFIFLDANEQYLASGSEDQCGVVWDRNYGIPLCRLPHANVVNSVGLNPVNPEMLVTASDDQSIKVWRSKRLCRELGMDVTGRTLGTFIFKNQSRH